MQPDLLLNQRALELERTSRPCPTFSPLLQKSQGKSIFSQTCSTPYFHEWSHHPFHSELQSLNIICLLPHSAFPHTRISSPICTFLLKSCPWFLLLISDKQLLLSFPAAGPISLLIFSSSRCLVPHHSVNTLTGFPPPNYKPLLISPD